MDAIPGLFEMRFCARCEKSVHWATSEDQRRRLADQGRCVAAELPLPCCDGSDARRAAVAGVDRRADRPTPDGAVARRD